MKRILKAVGLIVSVGFFASHANGQEAVFEQDIVFDAAHSVSGVTSVAIGRASADPGTGASPTVSLVDGGSAPTVSVFNSSIFNQTGGSSQAIAAFDSATVNFSGGFTADGFNGYNNSTTNITGGQIGQTGFGGILRTFDSATANATNVTLNTFVEAHNLSSVSLDTVIVGTYVTGFDSGSITATDCTIFADLTGQNSSTIKMTGGTVEGSVFARDGTSLTLTNATVGKNMNVFGSAALVALDGDQIAGNADLEAGGPTQISSCSILGGVSVHSIAAAVINDSSIGSLTLSEQAQASMTEGLVTTSVTAGNGASVTLTDVHIGTGAVVSGTAQMTLASGQANGQLTAAGSGQLVLTDEQAGAVTVQGRATLMQSGGSAGSIGATDSTTVSLSGGSVIGDLTVNANSVASAVSTSVGGSLNVAGGAQVNFQGAIAGNVVASGGYTALTSTNVGGSASGSGGSTLSLDGTISGNVAISDNAQGVLNTGAILGNLNLSGATGTVDYGMAIGKDVNQADNSFAEFLAGSVAGSFIMSDFSSAQIGNCSIGGNVQTNAFASFGCFGIQIGGSVTATGNSGVSLLAGTTVAGGVTVQDSATFRGDGAIIGGDVTVSGTGQANFNAGSVGGNMVATDGAVITVDEQGANVAGNLVAENGGSIAWKTGNVGRIAQATGAGSSLDLEEANIAGDLSADQGASVTIGDAVAVNGDVNINDAALLMTPGKSVLSVGGALNIRGHTQESLSAANITVGTNLTVIDTPVTVGNAPGTAADTSAVSQVNGFVAVIGSGDLVLNGTGVSANVNTTDLARLELYNVNVGGNAIASGQSTIELDSGTIQGSVNVEDTATFFELGGTVMGQIIGSDHATIGIKGGGMLPGADSSVVLDSAIFPSDDPSSPPFPQLSANRS